MCPVMLNLGNSWGGLCTKLESESSRTSAPFTKGVVQSTHPGRRKLCSLTSCRGRPPAAKGVLAVLSSWSPRVNLSTMCVGRVGGLYTKLESIAFAALDEYFAPHLW